MKYLFETHAHTSESSPCSNVKASALVKQYKDSGYSGAVITDHIGDWGFSASYGTWDDNIDMLYRAYEKARDAGEKIGFKVLFGMEIALNNPYRDYLVYGPDTDFLKEYKNIQNLSQKELYHLVDSLGGLLIVAHPFRGMGVLPDPKYLHGAEVYNSNPRNQSHNEKAMPWALNNRLIMTAGSDYHETEDVSSGIWTDTLPDDISDLITILKSGKYKLKTD